MVSNSAIKIVFRNLSILKFFAAQKATPGIVSGNHRKQTVMDVQKLPAPFCKRMPDKVRFYCLGKLTAEMRDWFLQMFNLNDV